MKQENGITSLSDVELVEITGGDPALALAAAAIVVAYVCWAAEFCYNLGKD